MNKDEIISQLSKSELYAECSSCGEEFRLSKSVIFDGQKSFPPIAEERRKEMLTGMQERLNELKRMKISAHTGAEKKAIEVGIGKNIEKLVPTLKDFCFPLHDCRPLFDPIDMIVFNGVSKMRVDKITFLEIKTGDARLNQHQKTIRDAVEDKKVDFKVV
jgi:predicted Holliday junction resolvase-like endonuclease